MTEPAQNAPDGLESDVEAAIAVCDGDVRAALRAVLVYNHFLEHELETARALVSHGYARGKISPARTASRKLDDWRYLLRSSNRAEKP
jgi:hypothetical protein